MQILSKKTLRDFWERHPQAQRPLTAWYQLTSSASWSTPADIKTAFGASVDFVADNRVVFDIAGNKYRLVVHVSYTFRRVLIKFVGTHADYDKIDVETV